MSDHLRLNVVELPKPVSDIPAMLRQLADNIEAGFYGEVPLMFGVIPREGEYPIFFGWGHDGGNPIVAHFMLTAAAHWLMTHEVER